MSDQDEMANNLIAAGAMWGLLVTQVGQTDLERAVPVMENGQPTNVIEVKFGFLKSPYRITVERVNE